MRPSNFNDISARVARGTLFITAVSMLSLHAMAQSSDAQKPLPSPIFAVAPIVPVLPATTQSAAKTADAKVGDSSEALTTTAATPPVQTGNRMSGFAVPADTVDTLTKSPTVTAPSKPAAVAVAPVAQGASSRAGIARLNQANAPAKTRQHPVADAYPGYDVIVCVAGCGPEPKAVSVYKPKPKQDFAEMQGGMQGGLIQVSMTTQTNATECLAGCYDDAPSRGRTITPANAAAAVASPGSPVGATDRSVMVQTSASMTAGPPHAKSKPKAAKKPSSEWFTRRFERKQTSTN
jgi:hypothetical protein